MSLLLLFAPRATATPAPKPTLPAGGGSAAAILRDAYREQRMKQDDRDLAAILPAVLHLITRRPRQ